MSRLVTTSLTSISPPVDSMPLRDEDDRERVRDGPEEPRDVPPDVALGEVEVALDDAAGSDELGSHRSPQGSHANTSLSSSLVAFGLELTARRGEERLLERLGVVAALEIVGRLEREQLPAVEDADALGEHLGLVEVVRAEQDRRVVRLADLADELLHLELRARVEARRRLVEEEDDRRREQRASERDLLLHPARQILHRLVAAVAREADALEDLGDPVPRLLRGHAVVTAPRS